MSRSPIQGFILTSAVRCITMSQEPVPSVLELSQSVKDLTSAVSSIQRQQERLLDSILATQSGVQASQVQPLSTGNEGRFGDAI